MILCILNAIYTIIKSANREENNAGNYFDS